jgi:hypothetical protein
MAAGCSRSHARSFGADHFRTAVRLYPAELRICSDTGLAGFGIGQWLAVDLYGKIIFNVIALLLLVYLALRIRRLKRT